MIAGEGGGGNLGVAPLETERGFNGAQRNVMWRLFIAGSKAKLSLGHVFLRWLGRAGMRGWGETGEIGEVEGNMGARWGKPAEAAGGAFVTPRQPAGRSGGSSRGELVERGSRGSCYGKYNAGAESGR
jgi:hypothetical protein